MTTPSGCSSTRGGYQCTRKRGHAGRHEARGLGGVKLSTWAPSAPSPKAAK